MKILIDMNLLPDWIHIFENSGIEFVHFLAISQDKKSIMFLQQNLRSHPCIPRLVQHTPMAIALEKNLRSHQLSHH